MGVAPLTGVAWDLAKGDRAKNIDFFVNKVLDKSKIFELNMFAKIKYVFSCSFAFVQLV